jgi:KaiC/GvpD/RAD55 family RecA-like ATPase
MNIPTFVSSLDTIINGGVPSGSSILLLGEPGAGNYEFAFTSAAKLSRAIEGIIPRELENKDINILDGIIYITLSKPASEITRQLQLTMEEDLVKDLIRKIKIIDFSSIYYSKTQIPYSWIGGTHLREREDLMTSLVSSLEKEAKGKMIILDSITDMITSKIFDDKMIFDLARGISRAIKKWDSLLYALMTADITTKENENILMDIFDGTMIFRWNTSDKFSRRKRFMFIPKFIGVLPRIEQERIERFDTDFDYKSGMVVLNTTKVK